MQNSNNITRRARARSHNYALLLVIVVSLPSSIQIWPIFVVTAGESEDTFFSIFPPGIPCQDAHFHHYISCTSTIRLWWLRSFARSFDQLSPSTPHLLFPLPHLLPFSVIPSVFPTGIKLQQSIYPHFFFWGAREPNILLGGISKT